MADTTRQTEPESPSQPQSIKRTTMSNQEIVTYLLCVWYGQNKSAEEIAQLLNQRGLLAPDLPKPDHDIRDPKWQTEYKEEYGYPAPNVWCVDPWFSIGVFPNSNEITIWDNGEPSEPFSIAEAQKFALNLLAASNYAKRNNK